MTCSEVNQLPAAPAGRVGWPWTSSPRALKAPTGAADWPKISIVTPSFNQGSFLEECIRSVVLQGYPNLEFILIDGGSSDNSVEIIKKYEPWLSYWVSEKDRGQSEAINKGFARATGELVNWLCSDDFLLPDALSNLAEAYVRVGDTEALYVGHAFRLEPNGALHPTQVRPTPPPLGLLDPPVYGGIQASWFWTRPALHQVGRVDETLHYNMDVDLFIRAKLKGLRWYVVDADQAVFRVHAGSKTSSGVLETMRERWQLFEKLLTTTAGTGPLDWDRARSSISGRLLTASLQHSKLTARWPLVCQSAAVDSRRLLSARWWRCLCGVGV